MALFLANTASTDPRSGPAAQPDVLGPFAGAPPVKTLEDWRRRRAALRAAFQEEIYGRLPDASAVRILSREASAGPEFDGLGAVIRYTVEVSATFGADTEKRVIHFDLVLPQGARTPVPTLLIGTFCPLMGPEPMPAATHGGPGVTCGDGLRSMLLRDVFHFKLATPPMEKFLKAGIAVAAVYPAEFVPDDPKAGLAALDGLVGARTDAPDRWGAIGAWAFVMSRMVDVLETEPAVDPCQIVALGHSRYGKAALAAAAFDDRIAGVVSRASGAGGAALSRGKKGETVAAVTKSYPHWFAPAFARYAGAEKKLDVDQHMLLALIAPRKIYLGNGREDIWSDPNGVWRAAAGASPVWRLYGKKGLAQAGLPDIAPDDADIVYRLRNGPHWALDRDWDDILSFMTARFCARGE